MIEEFDSPFDYPDEAEATRRAISQKRREARAKRLGRPVGTHGGYRVGSGRPSNKKYDFWIGVKVNRIQRMLLEEEHGTVQAGIQALIDKHL